MAKKPLSEIKQWSLVFAVGLTLFVPSALFYFAADPSYIAYSKIEVAFSLISIVLIFSVLKILQLLVNKHDR